MNLSRFQKGKLASFLALTVFLLGAAGGALVWAFLKILGMGMGFFWETLPQHLGAGSWYIPVLCLTGGLAIGLFQQKFGILPNTMAEVIAKVKRDGTYDYHRLPAIFTAVLLPLFAGGSLGLEAGLTGIITSLCFAWKEPGLRVSFIIFSSSCRVYNEGISIRNFSALKEGFPCILENDRRSLLFCCFLFVFWALATVPLPWILQNGTGIW
ncbi:hypothetical protein [Acidaminococcus fermentans]|uniref:hypothetical protein n=1 Tax=Acidaminococcus fermentans TaxID=905 RepID=UPI0039F5CEE5